MKARKRAQKVKLDCKDWIDGCWKGQFNKDFGIKDVPELPTLNDIKGEGVLWRD